MFWRSRKRTNVVTNVSALSPKQFTFQLPKLRKEGGGRSREVRVREAAIRTVWERQGMKVGEVQPF